MCLDEVTQLADGSPIVIGEASVGSVHSSVGKGGRCEALMYGADVSAAVDHEAGVCAVRVARDQKRDGAGRKISGIFHSRAAKNSD